MKYLSLTLLVMGLIFITPAAYSKTTCYGSTKSCIGVDAHKKNNIFTKHIHLAKKSKKVSRAFPQKRKSSGSRTFVFSPKKLMWAAYSSDGKLIKTGRASGGKGYCSDVRRSCRTPRGTFRVYSKGSPSCRSSKYPLGRGGAPMPYCMFFHRGYAIHGSPNVPNYNASHGCIRVRPAAAKWLSNNFMRHGTKVIVTPY